MLVQLVFGLWVLALITTTIVGNIAFPSRMFASFVPQKHKTNARWALLWMIIIDIGLSAGLYFV